MSEHASFRVGSQYASEAVEEVKRAIDSASPRNIKVRDTNKEGDGRNLIYADSRVGVFPDCKVLVEIIDRAGQRSRDVIVHDDHDPR